jgi:hypothetical protein
MHAHAHMRVYACFSLISTPGARYMCADVKKIYLNTLLDRTEYMQLALTIIPQEIIDKYKLMDKKKGKCTLELTKECAGSHKEADWQTTSWSHGWHPMDTAHAHMHMAYGGMP